ncbi:MAG: transcriptional repressor [Eubacterium sp.]|nr:transcriptional repressor [Eubacterium sp.]
MESRAKYRTKHRDDLLSFLRTIPGQHVTASDVQAYFKNNGKNIGTATIYRQLDRMVDEGLVTKFTIDSTSPACYQYLEPETHCQDDICYHCKCEECGRVIHLHCHEIPEFHKHILEHHGFEVNSMRTVYYGICSDCAKKRG